MVQLAVENARLVRSWAGRLASAVERSDRPAASDRCLLVEVQVGHPALVAEALIDVVARLGSFPEGDRYEVGPTIFAKRPIDRTSDAIVLTEDVVDGVARNAPEFSYVLEVSIAREVLEVWSRWRGGATPSLTEAVDAVIYYAANDAYLEPD